MRGPGMRLDYDMRRTWRCPACGSERKAGGRVTSLPCRCSGDEVWMKLIEVRRWRPPDPKPIDPYVDFEFSEEEAAPEPKPAPIVTPPEEPQDNVVAPSPASESPAESEAVEPSPAVETNETPPEQSPVSTSGETAQEPDSGKRNRKKRRGRSRRGRSKGRGDSSQT
ncbi:MAG: hypothetical protein DWQ34_23735 [Planctomycetota bacterium]|nr:MAG: hypothetical protein DWQ29_24660 [Planctomycetota bacterium]REJ87948.1 MAG: hypothetical protein DWQ34_23735 [Planctomycetota bacterium]REK23222.1 MAG: hypothetical protein DWQ41_17495 [Planctomycetota bacterium]REK30859.1 MAG: hypothetical protein DWQ45_20695 [Planctomycetota bacterium]